MHEHSALPLIWVPTKGDEIPPLAVPLHAGPTGQLYVARAFLDGDIHIGTTSYTSSKGARIRDRFGRNHDVFEYEVLTCASHVRFQLDTTPGVETARTTPRWADRPEVALRASTSTPPPKTPGRLAPFSWLSPRGQTATLPNETRGKRYQNDPPPYTSPRDGWVEPPKRARPIALNRRESVQFAYLAQSKCFVVIDDTSSMQYAWSQTRDALAGIIDIMSSDVTWDGLDVRFLYHGESRRCVKTISEFERIFNSVTIWRGDKVLTPKVSQVFAESFSIIHETSTPRPVVLLIVTDAVAIDTQELSDVIIRFCQRLNEKQIPNHMVRIHLLQMGEDRKAVKPLHDFRDRITQRDRERRLLNVVSFHRGRGLLNAQNIVKLLLASTSIPIEEDPDVGERASAEVVEAQYQEVDRIRTLKSWQG